MKLVTGLIDRLLFAAALLVALQIPQFIDHYTQRLAGYHQALADSVADYQRSADLHYGGNLSLMIHEFRLDQRPAVRDIADKIERERARLESLADALAVLRGENLLRRLWYMATRVDLPVARATFEDFKPGVPLTSDALICGLSAAVAASLLFNALLALLRWPLRRRPPGPAF